MSLDLYMWILRTKLRLLDMGDQQIYMLHGPKLAFLTLKIIPEFAHAALVRKIPQTQMQTPL